MENSNGASYCDKVDGIARWFGMSVAAAFFASLERCSCVNLNTSDSDDEVGEEAKDRPLMLTSASSNFTDDQNVNLSSSVEKLPV